MIPVPDHGFPELYQYLWKFIIIFVCRSLLAMLYMYQNTLVEKELLRACTDGDLETVQVGLLYAMFMIISSIMKTVLYTRLLGMT